MTPTQAGPSKSSGIMNVVGPTKVPGTPTGAIVTPGPRKTTTTTKGTGTTTGGTGGGGTGGGTGGSGWQQAWQKIRQDLTRRPAWYHGWWPIASMAATVRDLEFAMLNDLNQWPYNSLKFNDFNFTVTFTSNNQDFTLPNGIYFWAFVEDAQGNVPGQIQTTNPNGEAITQNPIAVTVGGTYLITSTYTLYSQLIDSNSKILYQFPGQQLQGAAMKQGQSLSLEVKGLIGATITFEVVKSGVPVPGASVYNIGVTPMTGTSAEQPIITGPAGSTESNGNYVLSADVFLNENWVYDIACAAAPPGSLEGKLALKQSVSAGTLHGGVTVKIDLASTETVQEQ